MAMFAASELGDEAALGRAFDAGADLDACDLRTNRKPLSWAAGKGHLGVVKMLLARYEEKGMGTDIWDIGNDAMVRAAPR